MTSTALAAKYAYVRVELAIDDSRTLVAGVELLADENAATLSALVRTLLRACVDAYTYPTEAVVRAAELLVTARWPQRSYFFEVDIDDGAWVQVFEPKHLVDPK